MYLETFLGTNNKAVALEENLGFLQVNICTTLSWAQMHVCIYICQNTNLQQHVVMFSLVCTCVLYCLSHSEQKVYVALDEPDGVAGVAAVRSSEPALQEEIVEFESTGQYSVL